MRLARSIDSFPFDLVAEGSVATIGSYDGLHRGHQKLLRHVLDHARKKRLPSIVNDPSPFELGVGVIILPLVEFDSHATATTRKAVAKTNIGANLVMVLPLSV